MFISSDMLSGDGGWLNTSNLSKEFIRSTIPSEPFSSSFLSSPSSRISWDKDAPTYRRSGHKKWLSTRSTLRNWDILWNNEPLIGNTDTVEPRIAGFDYVLRGLECEQERCVPKN